jgi:hypothetical protein
LNDVEVGRARLELSGTVIGMSESKLNKTALIPPKKSTKFQHLR